MLLHTVQVFKGCPVHLESTTPGVETQLTICCGLIQTVLEQGEALEHLQYIDNIIVWVSQR